LISDLSSVGYMLKQLTIAGFGNCNILPGVVAVAFI
jgi:hypothetical protein